MFSRPIITRLVLYQNGCNACVKEWSDQCDNNSLVRTRYLDAYKHSNKCTWNAEPGNILCLNGAGGMRGALYCTRDTL